MNPDRTRDELVELRLKNFAEKKNLSTVLFFMSISPEELECPVAFEGKRHVLELQSCVNINRTVLCVKHMILNL